jgi:DnaJ-class molecular chaperone
MTMADTPTPDADATSESDTTHDAASPGGRPCHACGGEGSFRVPLMCDDAYGDGLHGVVGYEEEPCAYCEGTGRELPHQTETRRLNDGASP